MEDISMEDPTNLDGAGEGDAGGVLNGTNLDDTGLMDDADLFGESGDGLGSGLAADLGPDFGVPVTLPSPPPPASVIFRIEEMQRNGCCSKLAWSNTGYIAQISSDGSSISFRTMIRDQKRSQWKLSDCSKSPIEAPEGRSFKHVCCGGMGTDLVAFDRLGHVHLYTLSGALGRLQPAQVDPSVSEGAHTELDEIVGMHWLPMYPNEFRVPYMGPANKAGDKWLTQTKNPDPSAPKVHHPAEARNALLYVSRTCKLYLLYQNESGIWQSASNVLETWHTSQQLLTHAAIGEEGDHLILVTHGYSRRFRVYKIFINWNATQQTRNNVNFVTVAPILDIGHLTILDNISPQHADMAKLSSLHIAPRVPDFVAQGLQTSTTVVAAFTYASPPTNAAQPQQDSFSILARWSLETVSPSLHESFTKLKPNGPTPVLPAVTRLRRHEDMLSSKIILGLHSHYHNTDLLCVYSDGTVEHRERFSWTATEAFGDTTTASGLPQSGLEFLSEAQTPCVALNADASFLAYLQPDGTIGPKYVTSRYGWQPIEHMGTAAGLVETAVVCMARQYAVLTSLSSTSDEALAVLPSDLAQHLKVLFVKQILRIMCRFLDVSMLDHQKQQRGVTSEPMHIRAISAQLVLGTNTKTGERGFAAQFAYAYLNLRHLSLSFAQVFTRSNDAQRSPELCPSLVGVLKFTSDLMVYIIDSLLQVKRSIKPGTSAKEAFTTYIASTGNPSLHLLLCSFPRVFLRMQSSFISNYLKWVQHSMPRSRSIEQRLKLEEASQTEKEIPFTYQRFGEMMVEFDAAVRTAYTEAGAGGDRRMEIELAMWTEGAIPDELVPALERLVDTILPKTSEHVDGGKVYFRDTEWLGIRSYAVAEKGGVKYDAIRKLPLAKGAKLRLCRRCGAEMEDLSHEVLRQAPDWLRHTSRHCFCQDFWWSGS